MFGLKSGYLDTFLQSLIANGVPDVQRISCAVRTHTPPVLRAVRAIAPDARDFQVSAIGSGWLTGINKVTVSLTASIATSRLRDGTVAVLQGTVGRDITADFRRWAVLLDRDGVYREMVERRRSKRWWNFAFDRPAIDGALASEKYEILGLPGMLNVRDAADLLRLNRLASSVVRQLFESAYRKQESRKSHYALIDAAQSGIPEQYYKEFQHAP